MSSPFRSMIRRTDCLNLSWCGPARQSSKYMDAAALPIGHQECSSQKFGTIQRGHATDRVFRYSCRCSSGLRNRVDCQSSLFTGFSVTMALASNEKATNNERRGRRLLPTTRIMGSTATQFNSTALRNIQRRCVNILFLLNHSK